MKQLIILTVGAVVVGLVVMLLWGLTEGPLSQPSPSQPSQPQPQRQFGSVLPTSGGPTAATARVIASPSAIMRVNATTASARVTAVSYGQTVKLLEQNVAGQELTIAGYPTSNLWHKVEWGGFTGYIWAPLLQ